MEEIRHFSRILPIVALATGLLVQTLFSQERYPDFILTGIFTAAGWCIAALIGFAISWQLGSKKEVERRAKDARSVAWVVMAASIAANLIAP